MEPRAVSQLVDGPASPHFAPVHLRVSSDVPDVSHQLKLTAEMRHAIEHAPVGPSVAWGIPFEIAAPVLVSDQAAVVEIEPIMARWLVWLHTAESAALAAAGGGLISPMRGEGRLNEHAADYVVMYEDGTERRLSIRRRHQIGAYTRRWGENCFQAVAAGKPRPVRASHEQTNPAWGSSQMRVSAADSDPWVNWLWGWENPSPDKLITSIRFEPIAGTILVFALSAGDVNAQPLRWESRRKAILRLPEGVPFQPALDEQGLLAQIKLDLGQVIAAQKRPVYPVEDWSSSSINEPPAVSETELLIEYTAHSEASFHLWNGTVVPVHSVTRAEPGSVIEEIAPADRRVTLRVVERDSGKKVAARLHLHGKSGEYLAPLDRHRLINTAWFEDYSVDFSHQSQHPYTYVDGETVVDLPSGPLYVEASKGFEFRPIRQKVDIGPSTDEMTIEVERVLSWRDRGWVTADTHVHFLSPATALLEGAAEGVNVVNLLASRWGELVTNVGDFDGQTTWGSQDAAGEGEYLVRVGTENRQHVMGHISLLGYGGRIIAPLTVGGPDESALGDPVSVLLTDWARQCHQQGGVVVVPHFPNPRAEHAASIVLGEIDAVEMTSWADFYAGIDPYSLSDWYRYLNCGYMVAAVGGTDKMSAETAVGAVRTYAHLADGQPFTYGAWMDAIRRAETFVTYGPLLEFFVGGKPMGSRLSVSASGGAIDLTWNGASVTIPMTRVELVVNGEIRESVAVDPWHAAGSWSLRVDRSCWAAILVRGQYADQPEMIAAHSSPVLIDVAGSMHMAAADAVTILEQIEGAMAYLDTVGSRAEDRAYKRMRLVLSSAHRGLHNRLHLSGNFHDDLAGGL
jgi:hypothetical protein